MTKGPTSDQATRSFSEAPVDSNVCPSQQVKLGWHVIARRREHDTSIQASCSNMYDTISIHGERIVFSMQEGLLSHQTYCHIKHIFTSNIFSNCQEEGIRPHIQLPFEIVQKIPLAHEMAYPIVGHQL